MSKKNKYKQKINWKRELSLLPGYLIVTVWIVFTAAFLIWILGASLSTSAEIFTGSIFKFETGFHWENYKSAWETQNVSVFFLNSLLYAAVACVFVILISAPAAYVLSRYEFVGNKMIKSGLIIAMSIPVIMIIMPLFALATQWQIKGRLLLMLLYIFLNVPFTTTYLLNFFATLSKTYEEAAAIDGCAPVKTFWVIMLPLVQPAIITVTIFNFLSVWNEFFIALIFASTDKMKSVGVGLLQIVNSMKYTGNYGGLFAAVVIVFLPTFILYILLSEKIISGVTGGGVKG
ncbi:carbohydrate ABC transporter permease [Faecalicatena acetigenes]|uniref:Carbohydrate ABC transporter permease n=1 Tax=Faecalicatena acetigenes TaxID=2981790 RepID=A0ABT2TDS6_9FIRM|nr:MULTISPECIES: carbohydrate ABC transporter permease [Lachnospiraceae]MCU6748438.1 carbohydrate ABC transporter permease [Faecalicatena acetigenes]SCI44336.1 Inner membrane ABC transporter permease protein ycjP [uncultured Clostridium sp.]